MQIEAIFVWDKISRKAPLKLTSWVGVEVKSYQGTDANRGHCCKKYPDQLSQSRLNLKLIRIDPTLKVANKKGKRKVLPILVDTRTSLEDPNFKKVFLILLSMKFFFLFLRLWSICISESKALKFIKISTF